MGAINRIKALVNSPFNAANLLPAYQQIALLTDAVCILRIINNSNVVVVISYDGVTDNDFLPANSILQLDFQTNAVPNNNVALLSKGTRIYALGAVGVGFIVVTGYFIPTL